MSFLRRHQPPTDGSSLGSIQDPGFQQRFPALFEYLTADKYPDGSPRQTASLSLFSQDGLWKGALNEKDQGLVLFVSEARFETLLEALELLLQEEQVPWRKSKPMGRAGPQKGR